RTRLPGLALGLVFHFVLSLDSVIPILGFSAAIFALYTLYLPEPLAERIASLRWLRAPALVAVVAGSVALALLCGRGDGQQHLFLLPPAPAALPEVVAVGGALLLRSLWHLFGALALLGFAMCAPRGPWPLALPRSRVASALLAFPA